MSFEYYRPVTLDHTKMGGSDLTNYPVGFIGTYAWCATVANGGRARNASGYDAAIPFPNSGLTSGLDYELVKYDATTGEIERYFRQPTASSSVDDVVYMGVGDTSISVNGSVTTTWNSGFRAVYHMGDGSTLSVADSTANGITLTNTASVAAAVGPNTLGGCASFNGTSNYLVKTGGAIEVGEPITVSFLANPDAVAAQRTMVMQAIQASPTTNCPINFKMNTAKVRATYNASNLDSTGTLSAGSWAYVMSRWVSSSSLVLHVNTGTDSATPAGALNGSINTTAIGALVANGTVQGFFDGDIDEVRFSDVDRGAAWATAEYNNLLSPSTFYSVGSEVAVGGGAATSRPIFSASKPRFTTPRRRML